MKRGSRRCSRHPAVAMNTMMMVDVLFILLIFFIVVSEVRSSRVDVDLPEIERRDRERSAGRETMEIQVTIDASDSIFLEGEVIETDDDLRRRLAGRSGEEVSRILLRADRESSGARLVRLVEVLSESGFRSISFDVYEGGRP